MSSGREAGRAGPGDSHRSAGPGGGPDLAKKHEASRCGPTRCGFFDRRPEPDHPASGLRGRLAAPPPFVSARPCRSTSPTSVRPRRPRRTAALRLLDGGLFLARECRPDFSVTAARPRRLAGLSGADHAGLHGPRRARGRQYRPLAAGGSGRPRRSGRGRLRHIAQDRRAVAHRPRRARSGDRDRAARPRSVFRSARHAARRRRTARPAPEMRFRPVDPRHPAHRRHRRESRPGPGRPARPGARRCVLRKERFRPARRGGGVAAVPARRGRTAVRRPEGCGGAFAGLPGDLRRGRLPQSARPRRRLPHAAARAGDGRPSLRRREPAAQPPADRRQPGDRRTAQAGRRGGDAPRHPRRTLPAEASRDARGAADAGRDPGRPRPDRPARRRRDRACVSGRS